MGWMSVTAGLALVLVAAGAGAQTGDADHGEKLARQWCTSCHVVDHGGRGADAGPALPMLLEQDLRTSDQIRGWLANPHGAMPNLDLTRQEIEDIVAYLEKLREERQQ